MNYEQFEDAQRHIRNLKRIFPATRELYDSELYTKLRRLEASANRVATQYCNGDIDQEQFEKLKAGIMRRLDALLQYKASRVPVFFNEDPRGHTLKVDDTWVRKHPKKPIYRDWGGYGVLAP